MRRDLWTILILGCLLIVWLEAPAALSSVSAGLDGPYAARSMRMSEVRAAERRSEQVSRHVSSPHVTIQAAPQQAQPREVGR